MKLATQKLISKGFTGIPPEMIRLSIGIEHIEDIVAVVDQALCQV